jgi:transposase
LPRRVTDAAGTLGVCIDHPNQEQPDMSSVPVTVGLDYAQNGVRVCVMDNDGRELLNRDVENSVAEIARVVERIGRVRSAAIEACSGAADLAEALANERGWVVHMAHPGFVKRMKQNPDKSDYTDAQMLTDLERVGYLPQVWIAPRVLRDLRALVRDRQSLARQRRSMKQQIGAVLRENRQRCALSRWTKAWLAWVEKEAELGPQSRWVVNRRFVRLRAIERELELVERRLAEVTADDALVRRLLSQRGIGPITAWTLRAEIGRFDRFRSGKQLARFCGLSPRNASSGERQADAGLIKAANRELRRVLIEGAWGLRRHHPRWRSLARSLEARGKPGSVVSAAIANRFVRWLWHQMMELEPVNGAA